MRVAVASSLTAQSETTTLGAPAEINDRERPITPSPVMRPRPVSQALRTTSSAFLREVCRISLLVNNPSEVFVGVSAIAPGMPTPPRSSSNPCVAKCRSVAQHPPFSSPIFHLAVQFQGVLPECFCLLPLPLLKIGTPLLQKLLSLLLS